jgi:hypothetical protein
MFNSSGNILVPSCLGERRDPRNRHEAAASIRRPHPRRSLSVALSVSSVYPAFRRALGKRIDLIPPRDCCHENVSGAHVRCLPLRLAWRNRVLGSQHRGPLDYGIPLLVRGRNRGNLFLARRDVPLFSNVLVAFAKAGGEIIAGFVCRLGNMDHGTLHADLQCQLLWRRTDSTGCLAFFCDRNVAVSFIYLRHVHVRWDFVCPFACDFTAAHPGERSLRKGTCARVPPRIGAFKIRNAG